MKFVQTVSTKLISIEIWIIALCVLISIIFPAALVGVVGVGLLFWLLRLITARRSWQHTTVDLSILVLLLLIPLNLWITAIPSKTYPQIYRLLTGVLLFFSIVNWARTSRQIRWAVLAVVVATVLLALFATVSVEWSAEKLRFIPVELYQRFNLLVSDTVHRNVMAGFLVILYPITLSILVFTWKELHGWRRLFLILAAGVVLGILILTQSRGGLLALGVVLLLLVTLRWKWGWLILILAMLAMLGIIAYFGLGRSIELLASGVSLEGLQGRLEAWSRAIFMIQDFPFTGVGMGLYGDVADSLYPFFMNAPGTVPHAHNLYLQIAVDMGIPGLIAWLSILMLMVSMCWQLFQLGRRRRDSWVMGLGAGLFGSQAALIVHGFLDAATWGGVRPAPILWAIWGVACAAWNYYQKRAA